MKSEDELIAQARCGGESAFTELVSIHKHRVYRVCLAMTGDPQAADEAAQDVFVKLHESIAAFRGDSKLGTWLYRVAFNVCVGRKRAWARWLTLDLDLFHGVSPDRPDWWAERREDVEMLNRALDRLPAEFREALILRELEGRTYEQIADVLNISIGTVESRIFRGRKRLKELLDKENADGI